MLLPLAAQVPEARPPAEEDQDRHLGAALSPRGAQATLAARRTIDSRPRQGKNSRLRRRDDPLA